MNKRQEKKILSKLLVNKFQFGLANGWVTGYGKDYREAARNLHGNKKTLHIGMLVRVISSAPNSKVGYWDGREFLKEVKKGDKMRSKKTVVTEGSSS